MADVFDRLNKIRTVDNPGKTPAKATERKTTKAAAGGNALERLDRVKTVDAMSRLDRIQTVGGKASAPRSSGKAETRKASQPSGTSTGQGLVLGIGGPSRQQVTRSVDRAAELQEAGYSTGATLRGLVEQGGDQFVGGVLHTVKDYVEKPLFTVAGAVLGNPELGEDAPVKQFSEWFDKRAEERREKYAENAAKGGRAYEKVNEYGSATMAALPNALVAIATAGGSMAAQGLDAVAAASTQAPGILTTLKSVGEGLAKNPNFWTSFLQVAGDGYEEAKADGASDAKAGLYGMVNGLANAAVEVGGGIQTLPTELQQGGKNAIRLWVESMVDEGKEEVVQGILERGLQNLVYDKKNPLVSTEDDSAVVNPRTALREFSGGAVVGGILGGGQMIAQGVASSAGRYAPNGAPLLTDEQGRTYEERMAAEQKNAAPRTEAAEVSLDEARQIARNFGAELRAEKAPDLGNENTVFAEGDGRTLYASMDIESEEQPHSRPYYAESAGDVMLRDADGKWVPRERFIQAEAERSVRELKGKSPFSEGFDRRILEDRTLLTATEVRKAEAELALSNKRRNASATDAARRAVSGAGFETGDVRNDWTGLNITVGNNFYSETATNAASQRNESSVQALRAARELMKSAYLVGTAETQIDVKSSLKRKNNPHRLFQYIFAAPYSMDGPKIAVLRVDVMENQGDVLHRAYNLRSVEYKNAPLGWVSEEDLRAGFQDRTTASGGYTISVADLVKNIKQDYVGNHVIFAAKEGTDITPRLTDEKGRTYEERQNSMGRSFTELVEEQRRAANGAPLLVDEKQRTYEERLAAESAGEPKVPDLAAESRQKAMPGDSGTDGYLDALAESGEPLRDPITPADRIYEARLDRLQREEAPPERGGTRIEKRDLDEFAQLLQDTANPVTMARDARLEESAGLVSAETREERKTIWEKAGEAKSYFLRKMVDAGDSVARVAKAAGDNYLYPFYNMARSSASAGINMIAGEQTDITGKRVGRSLNDIFQPIRAKGEDYYNRFQTYLFDLHNVDRMSLVRPDSTVRLEAEEALRAFDQENPDVAQMTEARLRKRAEDIDPDVAELARERLRLRRRVNQADRLGNKPVFSFEVTAEMSRERAAQLLRENPEFSTYQKQVREYIHNLMQYRVDSGLMTQKDMDFLEQYYPNYVPTFRRTERTPSTKDRRNVRIGKTVGRAEGGNQKLVPLHEALGKMTMSVVREGSKNRFGERLLETWQNSRQDSRVREYILEAEEYDASFDPETFDKEDPTPRKENTFTVYKDGKLWEMQLDPSMFDAVKALSPDTKESNWAVNLVRAGNNLFKALVTGYNPTFVVRNTVRDLQTAGLYSRDGKAFLENYPLALREIKRDGAYWKQYKALGGSFSSVFDYQTGTVQEPSGKVAKLAARMEALNMAMEQAPRLAEFMSVVKAGDGSMENLMDAMHAAADVTVNFGRAGTLGKMLNAKWIPFLNPGIQGFDKMIRRVTETKGAKQWSSLIVRAAALGIAPTLLNALLYDDDDEWEDLKDSDKDANYLFKIKDGLWLKIPKGRELSILGMTADRIQDIVNGRDVDWRDFITTVGNQVAPANPLNQNILKAWFDAALLDPSTPGRTWYGGDIENQRLRNYAPGERYDSSTDIFSKWVGKQLGLSPKKINYLLDQYSGVVGDFLLPLLTPQAERDPFSKAFTVDSVNSNRLSGDFYDTAEQLTYAANGGDSTAKAASRFWSKQQKACSDLYAEIREIEESDLSDKEKKQKVKEVKTILNGIQKNALATLETYEGTVEKYLKGSGEEDVDLAYREANRECFGAEYALQVYNKDVYEKAKNAAAGGVSYEDYYTYYFETKAFQSSGGVSVATQKMRWLEASDFDDETKAEIYFADLASDSDLTKQAELESSSGLTAVEYWEYKMATNGIQADRTESGKTIAGSKKQKVLAAIDAMDITKEQKTALYYAAGYAESTLTEAPWMGLQVPRLDGGAKSSRKKSSGKSTGKSSSGGGQKKSGLSKYSLDKYRLG